MREPVIHSFLNTIGTFYKTITLPGICKQISSVLLYSRITGHKRHERSERFVNLVRGEMKGTATAASAWWCCTGHKRWRRQEMLLTYNNHCMSVYSSSSTFLSVTSSLDLVFSLSF